MATAERIRVDAERSKRPAYKIATASIAAASSRLATSSKLDEVAVF